MKSIMNLVTKLTGKKPESVVACDPEELARTILMNNEHVIKDWYNTK